jgi:hypothetical protein
MCGPVFSVAYKVIIWSLMACCTRLWHLLSVRYGFWFSAVLTLPQQILAALQLSPDAAAADCKTGEDIMATMPVMLS